MNDVIFNLNDQSRFNQKHWIVLLNMRCAASFDHRCYIKGMSACSIRQGMVYMVYMYTWEVK